MWNINSYFEKFKNIGIRELYVRQVIAEIINKNIGSAFLPEHINLKNGIITLKASPALKSQLFMKKASILHEITERNLSTKINDLLFY